MDKMQILKNVKKELEKEGFHIVGIVGSFARGEKYNDIDIIYETDEQFESKYFGWNYFIKLEEVKIYLEDILKSKVDLVNYSAMNNIARKYMMKDLINDR